MCRLSRQLLLALLICWLSSLARAVERLPALHADLTGTSVSGVSSGGFMAVQFHVAHSSAVVGAAVLAGGPYYCAQGNVWVARNNCMRPSTWAPLPAVSLLKLETDSLAQLGQIDPPDNLRRARVWLFWGTRDATVQVAVVEALQRYYSEYVPSSAIEFVRGVSAGHAMVTSDYGESCGSTAAPFINDCDFDAAGELLRHLYGRLSPPAAQASGRMLAFDQNEFAAGHAHAASLADTGYAYIPQACESGRCRVHVAFHGCKQSVEAVGLAFVSHAGYNRWADTNRLLVLYPQTIARYGVGGWPVSFVFNPNGCWDWWGYSAALYHTKNGPQIRAVRAMLERLGQPR